MKPLSETLEILAEKINSLHNDDSDWLKGYVKGLKRAASIAEVYEAFEESGDESRP